MVRRNSSAERALLLPIQLGVGVPGGCEIALHCLQSLPEDSTAQRCILSIDFANAFNEVHRQHVLQAFYDQPSLAPLYPIVSYAYSSPSPLLVMNHSTNSVFASLQSSNGVRQGCPLSSLLFAVSVNHIYNAVTSVSVLGRSFAVIDDLTIALPPADVPSVYRMVKEEAQKISA